MRRRSTDSDRAGTDKGQDVQGRDDSSDTSVGGVLVTASRAPVSAQSDMAADEGGVSVSGLPPLQQQQGPAPPSPAPIATPASSAAASRKVESIYSQELQEQIDRVEEQQLGEAQGHQRRLSTRTAPNTVDTKRGLPGSATLHGSSHVAAQHGSSHMATQDEADQMAAQLEAGPKAWLSSLPKGVHGLPSFTQWLQEAALQSWLPAGGQAGDGVLGDANV